MKIKQDNIDNKQVYVHATLSANQALALEGTHHKIEVDNVINNIGGGYNPDTYTFTTPHDGFYIINVSGRIVADSTGNLERAFLVAYKNGTDIAVSSHVQTTQPASDDNLDYVVATLTSILYLNKSDIIDFTVYYSTYSGTAYLDSVSTYTYFQIKSIL